MHRDAVLASQFPRALGKFPFGKSAKMMCHWFTVIGQNAGHRDDLVRKDEAHAVVPLFHAQYDLLSAKKKPCAIGPWLPRGAVTLPFRPLSKKPQFASFKKAEGFVPVAPARNDKPCGVHCAKPEKITPGLRLANEVNRDAVFPGQWLKWNPGKPRGI